jgi:YD repeat-containing protein
VTDEKSQQTSFAYDELFRPTRISFPIGQTSWSYNDTALPANVVTTTELTSSTNRIDTEELDGLGRVSQTQLNTDVATDYVDFTYDALGRAATRSNPYRSKSDNTYGLTSYSYDPLGRVTAVGRPDSNTVSISYSGNCATVADEAGKGRESCYDALGRLTTVYEDPGSSPHLNYTTSYAYDLLDNLTSATHCSQTRTYRYDMLGRLTSAATPESATIHYCYTSASSSCTTPDTGTTLCAGDPNAVCRRTDVGGITSAFAYDALNCLTGKTHSDSTPRRELPLRSE